MRVQRAPLAAEQPSRAPVGLTLPGRPAAPFSAEVSLDVTALRRQLPDEAGVTAAVIVRLLAACRREGLLDAGSALCVVRPAGPGVLGGTCGGAAGVLGGSFGEAAGLSASGIAAGLRNLTPGLPAISGSALTVVDLSGTRVGVTGDWGYGGRAVVTLGASVSTLVPGRPGAAPGRPGAAPGGLEPDPGLRITERAVARLSFTVRDPAADAPGAVRVLDALARSIEDVRAAGDLR
jgi:hypothetical protein